MCEAHSKFEWKKVGIGNSGSPRHVSSVVMRRSCDPSVSNDVAAKRRHLPAKEGELSPRSNKASTAKESNKPITPNGSRVVNVRSKTAPPKSARAHIYQKGSPDANMKEAGEGELGFIST